MTPLTSAIRLRVTGTTFPRPGALLVVAGTVAYASLMVAVMNVRSYDLWGGLLFGPVLVLISIPVLRAVARADGTPGILPILVTAVILKVLAAGARYWMAFVLYGGSDALGYHQAGVELSAAYRAGILTTGGNQLSSTEFLRIVSGVVYTVIGPSLMGGMVVFSWLGFWGLVMLWRAFRIGVPDGDGRRYALLVFLLPSMLFWPSALGKEAVMSLCLGAAALGTARLFAGRRGWLVPIALGMAGTAFLRPHFAAMVFAGLFAGFLVRPPARRTVLTPLVKASGVIVLVAVGLLVARQAAEFFNVEVSAQGVERALNSTAKRTEMGGSTFQAQPVRSPLDLPRAFLTVAFRPYPWEASSVQAALQSLESVFLLGLLVMSWPRLHGLGRRLREQPYIVSCLVYAVMFVYAFSTFGNFGLLARQRVLLYPFLLVVACLPAATRRAAGRWNRHRVAAGH